jgi:hypothetical protein
LLGFIWSVGYNSHLDFHLVSSRINSLWVWAVLVCWLSQLLTSMSYVVLLAVITAKEYVPYCFCW